jgi:hypothetical protein
LAPSKLALRVSIGAANVDCDVMLVKARVPIPTKASWLTIPIVAFNILLTLN